MTTRQLHQAVSRATGEDVDLKLDALGRDPELLATAILERLLQVASRDYTPKLFAQGNTDFQITRGLLGVSL